MLLAHAMPLMVLGLWFGGRQPTFRNCSRLANVSSRDTGTVQCGREETEAGRDVDDSLVMTWAWIWLEREEMLEFRDGSVERQTSVETIWDRVSYVPRAMAHWVGREKSIWGSQSRGAKIGRLLENESLAGNFLGGRLGIRMNIDVLRRTLEQGWYPSTL